MKEGFNLFDRPWQLASETSNPSVFQVPDDAQNPLFRTLLPRQEPKASLCAEKNPLKQFSETQDARSGK